MLRGRRVWGEGGHACPADWCVVPQSFNGLAAGMAAMSMQGTLTLNPKLHIAGLRYVSHASIIHEAAFRVCEINKIKNEQLRRLDG